MSDNLSAEVISVVERHAAPRAPLLDNYNGSEAEPSVRYFCYTITMQPQYSRQIIIQQLNRYSYNKFYIHFLPKESIYNPL